jgi:RHS repeat-associated protein
MFGNERTTLVRDKASGLFLHTDTRGRVRKFYAFGKGSLLGGQFAGFVDPYGGSDNHSAVPTYNNADQLVSVVRTSEDPNLTDGFYYDYYSSTNLLQYVTHKVDGANVRRGSYEYYGGSETNGNLNDLKKAVIQQWDKGQWVTLKTSYYRFWKTGSGGGVPHGLKFVVLPEAYARMVAAGLTPETATDAQVAGYADYYFEYDGARRVKLEKLYGGSETYTYAYLEGGSSDDYNEWTTRTTETLPNGAQNIVYCNFAGQIMLKVYKSGSDKWYEFNEYDDSGHVILQASSSGVTGYSESYPDLLNKGGDGKYQYLSSDSGLIRLFEFYTGYDRVTGAAKGYLHSEQLQKGQNGTPIHLRDYSYTWTVVGKQVVVRRWKVVCYPDDANSTIHMNCTIQTYKWYPQSTQVKEITTYFPLVATTQNGSGVSTTRKEYFNRYGQLTWTMDERGIITRLRYHLSTGALMHRIDDVNTSLVTEVPPGWVTPADAGQHLMTDYQADLQGRTTLELGPDHTVDLDGVATIVRRTRWTVYLDSEQMRYEGMGYASGGAYTLINPAKIFKLDYADRLVDEISATRADTDGPLRASDEFPQATWVRWSHFNYDNTSLLTYQRDYYAIPASGDGTSTSNYNQNDFAYDNGRLLIRQMSPGGTISRRKYDIRNQLIEEWVGTDDTGATASDPGGSGSSNMKQVVAYEYDNAAVGKDGNLTKETRYENASSTRVTIFGYDFRNRRINTDGEIDLYEEYTYDNLDRLTQTDRKDTNSSGALIARSKVLYDDLGRVYQDLSYAVTGGAAGNSVVEKLWYDPSGNVIKRVAPGSRHFQKTQYDSISRPIKTFICYDLSEADTDYAAAGTVTGDTVIQQIENNYDEASNVIQVTTRDRFHDATGTGELTSPSGSQPKARVSYRAIYPDPVGRVRTVADYGTNGGSSFSRSATAPGQSDSVLVTNIDYNDRGEANQTMDPNGKVNQSTFDDLGRQTKLIENYVSGGTNPDQNRETDYAYNGDNRVVTLTAKNSVTGDEVTTWVYGTTPSDSDIASNDLLRFKQMPDNVSGSDQIGYKYNRLGQVKEIDDQNGSVRVLEYDKLGRLQHDRVTTLGNSGVDGAVRRITRSYEVRGMLQKLTSYDNASTSSGTVVNEIQYAYNGFAQRTTEYQAHGGAVNTSTSPKVQYGYADGSSGYIRRTSSTYPDGTVISLGYGSSGSAEDVLNRLKQLTNGSTMLADYSYLGMGQAVITSNQIGSPLTYYTSGGSGDGGDQYTGLDRFGRIIDQRWMKGLGSLERVKYGFDAASNRVWRQNTVAGTGQDEYYTYDGLYQVKTLQRGTLNGGKTGISGTPSWEEDWNYDPLGNWHGSSTGYLTKASGTTTLDQNRTHNKVNEITGVTTNSGTAWSVPSHDANGNMTSVPQPLSLGTGYDLKYDPWNRLVQVKSGGTTISTYAYDGANRRVTKATGSTTRHYYYSDEWQILEERLNSNSTADRRYVWGIGSLDDLIFRDRVLSTGGGGGGGSGGSSSSSSSSAGPVTERLFALHDAMGSVTTITDALGTVVERYGYDGFGGVRYMTAAFAARSSSSYDWETLFDGYRYDAESGFYQVRNRYLHPKLGRWITQDPIDYGDDYNFYAFVLNCPTSEIDDLGLKVVTDPKTKQPSCVDDCKGETNCCTCMVYCEAAEGHPGCALALYWALKNSQAVSNNPLFPSNKNEKNFCDQAMKGSRWDCGPAGKKVTKEGTLGGGRPNYDRCCSSKDLNDKGRNAAKTVCESKKPGADPTNGAQYAVAQGFDTDPAHDKKYCKKIPVPACPSEDFYKCSKEPGVLPPPSPKKRKTSPPQKGKY